MFNPEQVKKQEEIESRQKINKLLMLTLLLAGFFVWGTAANSAQIAPAHDYDINWLDTGNDESNFGRDYIFQKFVPSANTISGLELYFTGVSATVNLCRGALDTDRLLNNHACANGILVASTTCSTNASPRWYSGFSDCPFSVLYALIPGTAYYYEIIGVWTRASGL